MHFNYECNVNVVDGFVNLCFHQDAEEGLIAYEDVGVKTTLPYHIKDLEGGVYPQLGDKVL